jgi:acyl carrier protein
MTSRENYDAAFIESLGVDAADLPGLTYRSVPAWDSVGHMGLMATLEESFGMALDMDDIIDFSSYEKGIEILAKYDITV